ncbi:hypothetical protein E4U13_007493 [Claviceps humidiphila]|uniref:Uncharacterized protein n=1 Tax=Claviceps humidiphila TaxID=1294629 RepID=A0A9P7PVQ9_9HYPO|nr:hypothetical protein E4U32_008222 [Claviceps aff. humidiphila group G2b]KAG6106351.1 hypothetical protein E4U13_007493 [Claviceps humidiphila]
MPSAMSLLTLATLLTLALAGPLVASPPDSQADKAAAPIDNGSPGNPGTWP